MDQLKPRGGVPVLSAVLLMVLGCGCGPSLPPAYVYVSSDGDQEIFTMAADGGSRRQVTRNTDILDGDPVWSPDGASFFFTSGPLGGGQDIYVANADGSGMVQVAHDPADEWAMDWSPDGTRILLTYRVLGGQPLRDTLLQGRPGSSIVVMNRDGSGRVPLTDESVPRQAEDWSPDGSKILFTQQVPPAVKMLNAPLDLEIYVVSADGSDTTNLTNSPTAEDTPSWSPDGERILFRSDRTGHGELYLMNADGSGVGRLTEEVVGTQSGAWSPDGKQIVFDSTESWDLWLVNADGTGLRKLTDAGSDPSWCDGGTRVVFVIRNGANSKAYSINADGTGLTRIGEPDEDHEVYKPKCRPSVP